MNYLPLPPDENVYWNSFSEVADKFVSLCPPKHVVSFSEPLDFLVCLCPELCPYVQIFMRTASSWGAEPNLAQLDGWSHLALAHVSQLHSPVSHVIPAMVLKKPSAFLLKTSVILLFRRKCFFITRYIKTIITLNNEKLFCFYMWGNPAVWRLPYVSQSKLFYTWILCLRLIMIFYSQCLFF